MGLASSGTSNETRDVTCSRLLLEHRLIVNSVVELTVALALEKDHSKQYLASRYYKSSCFVGSFAFVLALRRQICLLPGGRWDLGESRRNDTCRNWLRWISGESRENFRWIFRDKLEAYDLCRSILIDCPRRTLGEKWVNADGRLIFWVKSRWNDHFRWNWGESKVRRV